MISLCAWKLKAKHVGYLYSFLAATCSFNAVDNISELFGGVGYVNGEESTSDAHTVAEYWGGSYTFWATLWLLFALACSAVGLLFAFDGHTYKQNQKATEDNNNKEVMQLPVVHTATTATAVNQPWQAEPVLHTTETAVAVDKPWHNV